MVFGEMSSVLTVSQRMVPASAVAWGYQFRHPDLGGALEAALR
jgi:NAD dependent epimerase/dehydratase family enzyme